MKPLKLPNGEIPEHAYFRQSVDETGAATITLKEYGAGGAWLPASTNGAPIGQNITAIFEVSPNDSL